MRVSRGALLLVAAAIAAPPAQANVSLRNGNFFVAFTDATFSRGIGLKIERIYNSKTGYRGLFGWGWGTLFEAWLQEQADGSVVVHEYGGGAENVFAPPELRPAEIEQAIGEILMAKPPSAAEAEAYRARLRTDGEFRRNEWSDLLARGKVERRRVSVGTRFRSRKFQYQYLVRMPEGYVRHSADGRSERYDASGHLTRLGDPSGNFFEVERRGGRIARLVDNLNQWIELYYDGDGALRELLTSEGKRATYGFDRAANLVWSRDVLGKLHRLRYSADGRHNMTEIAYPDGTSLLLEYLPRDINENIGAIKDSSGTFSRIRYDYSIKATAPDKSVFAVIMDVQPSGGPLHHLVYEYHTTSDAIGTEWLRELVVTLDGNRQRSEFTTTCGRATRVERDGTETRYAYDEKGHVVRKEKERVIYEFVWNGFDRLDRVTRLERAGPGATQSTSLTIDFKRDDRGRAVEVVTSRGKRVHLGYDAQGTLESASDDGKPIAIASLKTRKDEELTLAVQALGEVSKAGDPWHVAEGWNLGTGVCHSEDKISDLRPAGVDLGL